MACMAVCTWNTTLKGNTVKSTSLGLHSNNGVLKPFVCPHLQALGGIFVPYGKKCISCFGRTFPLHGSQNCSAVQTYMCNCLHRVDGLNHALYRCFTDAIRGIKAMCPPGICSYINGCASQAPLLFSHWLLLKMFSSL